MSIISNILSIAYKEGMNDQDICKVLGLSKSGVYHWKNGKGEPSATQVLALAQYFNVSTDYLLTDKEHITKEKENVKMDKKNNEIFTITEKDLMNEDNDEKEIAPVDFKETEKLISKYLTSPEFKKSLNAAMNEATKVIMEANKAMMNEFTETMNEQIRAFQNEAVSLGRMGNIPKANDEL